MKDIAKIKLLLSSCFFDNKKWMSLLDTKEAHPFYRHCSFFCVHYRAKFFFRKMPLKKRQKLFPYVGQGFLPFVVVHFLHFLLTKRRERSVIWQIQKFKISFKKQTVFLKRFNVMFEIAKRRQLSESSIIVALNVTLQILIFWSSNPEQVLTTLIPWTY